MNEIMLCLDAALGPIALGIELALDPSLALDMDPGGWGYENLAYVTANLTVPTVAIQLAMVEVIKIAIDLPALGPPLSVGFSLPGWGTPQIDALTGLVRSEELV